jgi:hypothetical protein
MTTTEPSLGRLGRAGLFARHVGRLLLGWIIGLAIMVTSIATVARLLDDTTPTILSLVFLAATISFLIVGWLIVVRRPGNLVGPLVLGIGVPLAGYVVLDAYIRHPEPMPSTDVAALAISLMDGPLFFAIAMLFLVFPDGRPPSPRWRWLVGSTALFATLVSCGAALRPGAFPSYTWLDNPLVPPPTALWTIWEAVYGLTVLCVGIAALSLVGRWRRSGALERAQLKWAAAAASLVTAAMITYGAGAGPNDYSEVGDLAVGVSWTLFPAAIGIAVLRYRLYEIDRIISRTIGWALVTGILVAVFGGLVVGLQATLSGVTQGGTLAVAASTLVAFALFSPVRRRVQRVVDRRFDRARYDGERLVTAFGERLRDRVDLAGVEADIAATVHEALRPGTVTVWVRREVRG